MSKLMSTGAIAVAGLATTAMLAWQAPAFASHGADDGVRAGVTHRHHDGRDDVRGHDHGRHDHGRHGHDDGPRHDRGDDHGRHGAHD